MSISQALKELQDAQVLFPYIPPRTRQRAQRRLFLTETAHNALHDPSSATNFLCKRGPIEAALTKWVLGEWINGDRKGRFIRDLSPPPPEVWEIRVTEPIVQARLIGRFPEPDTLVLTSFHTRNSLGDKGSKAWFDAMKDCVDQWEAFSPQLPLFDASTIHEYILDNCDDFPIKRYPARKRNAKRTRSR